MLYLIDKDDYSFAVSYALDGTQEIRSKDYHAVSIAPVGDAEHGLLSIKHNDKEHGDLVSLIKPADINIDGTVYANAWLAAQAVNAFMANQDFVAPTTTTTPEPVTTTTTP